MPIDHIVAESETTSSLAAEYGFSPRTKRKLQADAGPGKEHGHKKILSSGAFIKIPDIIPKDRPRKPGSRRRFILKKPLARFKLQIQFAAGRLPGGSVFIEFWNAFKFYRRGA